MTWIKVTSAATGELIRVNMDNMEGYSGNNTGVATNIWQMVAHESAYLVNETPDEIDALIAQSSTEQRMLELARSNNIAAETYRVAVEQYNSHLQMITDIHERDVEMINEQSSLLEGASETITRLNTELDALKSNQITVPEGSETLVTLGHPNDVRNTVIQPSQYLDTSTDYSKGTRGGPL